MAWVLLAIGLVMIVEGLAYTLAPSLVERMLDVLRSLPEVAIRQIGGLAIVGGLMLVWLAHWVGV